MLLERVDRGGDMTGAGASAGAEQQASLLRIQAHERAIEAEHRRAKGFGVAARTEPVVAKALQSLECHGYVLLHDRRWPGTRRANLDHIAIGPGGVLVIDTKAWNGAVIVHGASLFQEQSCRDDELDKVRDQAMAVEGVLVDIGLAPLEVVPVMCFVNTQDMATSIGRVQLVSLTELQRLAVQRGARLPPEELGALVEHLDRACPPAPVRTRASAVIAPVVLPHSRSEPVQQSLISDEDLRMEAIEAACAQPIETWMAFLHPEQAKLVRRSFNGPSRIRGPAGTGKTVVGLHRAAYLAAGHNGRVLVTTFVRTLPKVMESLYRRLSPETADRVEFVGLHAWARRLLDDRGITFHCERSGIDNAFSLAYSRWEGRERLVTASTPVGYWRDEIDHVIKGRGLTRYDEYENLRRVGRRTRLTTLERELVWELYVAYQDRLGQRGMDDWNDLLHKALRSIAEEPLDPGYAAVVIDEVQDLNLLGLRLAHALIGDAPDGLTLVGDGQQAIYPGGYTLAEAGVSVAGRATVLRTNYRNTKPILNFAVQLVALDEFEDLGAELEQGQREVEVVRDGAEPIEAQPDSPEEHDALLLEQLTQAQQEGVRFGDLAVLVPTRSLANRYVGLLRRAAVPAVSLEDYDGTPTEQVKVGTFKRAKGLEFARVFLPQVSLPAATGAEADLGLIERLERERREYFVAMTRARDHLWVGYAPSQRSPSRAMHVA